MREDYQELVDEISALLGTPATLEDRDFGLIAFGAHPGDGAAARLDPVRTRSILQRGSSDDVRSWFEGFGIARARGPVRIPPDPAAGVETGRICLPARHGGVTYGYVWLLDDGALELDDPRLRQAVTTASLAAAGLARDAAAELRVGELLREVLTAAPDGREEPTAALRGALGAAGAGSLAMVAVVPWRVEVGEEPAGAALPNVAALSGVPLPRPEGAGPGTAGAGPVPVALAALVRLRSGGGVELARTAARRLLRTGGADASAGGRTTAGISAARQGLDGLAAAWREALTAARAARAEPRHGPVGEWDAIGPYRVLAGLPSAPVPDPAVRVLLDGAHRDLARTAEAYLDRAGQAARTAADLGIHRQTLYYRLSRVEELTGLDLDDGEDRLLLHLSLKAARL